MRPKQPSNLTGNRVVRTNWSRARLHFALAAACLCLTPNAGWSQVGSSQVGSSQAGSFQSEPAVATNSANIAEQTPKDQEKPPFQITSRFHLQEGKTETGTAIGYLVVKVALAEGNHIYSLTQSGDIAPSKIAVKPSKSFRINSKFTPDRKPKVIEHDPVLEQRVEKHTALVQFFAPIEIAPGVDPNALEFDLKFNGQVCSASGMCRPIMEKPLKAKFAGFFTKPVERQAKRQ